MIDAEPTKMPIVLLVHKFIRLAEVSKRNYLLRLP